MMQTDIRGDDVRTQDTISDHIYWT